MVKQIGTQSIASIKGQPYQVEPVSLDINVKGFHETKAQILQRVSNSKSRSRLDVMKKHGLSLDYPTQNVNAMKEQRKVIPFTGGSNSPFLNFKSGRASKYANAEKTNDPNMMKPVITTNTSFNRY